MRGLIDMSLKFESFPSAGGGAGTDTLDDVTGRGSSTANSITIGGLTIGTEYSLPAADGASNTYLRSDGAGNLSFAALDITGGLEYKGEYTGQSLVTAEKGDFYIVSGSQTLAGVSLSSGDHIVFNTNATDPVLSTQFDVIDNTETTPTLDAVTTQGASTTNDLTVGGLTVQGDISADGNLTRSIGDETNRFISYFGDVNGAIRFKAKNDSGGQLTKGQVVTITGVSGTVPTVDLADSNDSAKMPAFGLVYANANDQAEVQIVSFGNLENVNTGSFSAGDTLYVSTTAGALTATKPTGESSLLQNIGRVVRSDASAGVIIVGGAGRTAATPNLDQNKVFLGNASNQATPTALSSIALSSLNDDLSYLVPTNNLSDLDNAITARTNLGLGTSATLDHGTGANEIVKLDGSARLPAVDGSLLQNLPSASAASETVAGIIEIATNSEAQGASATDKALVPSNLGSIALSSLNDDLNYLSNVSEDSNPSLGGDLDTNQNEIVTTSNRNLILRANGTGAIQLGGNTNPAELRLYCESSDAHYVALKSPTHSQLSGGSITWRLPTSDASNPGDALISDGSGNLSFTTISGGGGSPPTITSASPSSNYTISTHTGNEEVYILNPSTDLSVLLPTSASCGSGFKYQIKNLGAYTLTITPDSTASEYIDFSSQTTFSIVQYESVTLISDGANNRWFII